METIYLSKDKKQFPSKKDCKLYEEALQNIDHIDRLQYEIIGGHKFFKINDQAELYFFDHMDDTPEVQSDKTLYDVFKDLRGKSSRVFPLWIREDGQATKKSEMEKKESRIEELKTEIDQIREEISQLKGLNSRKKNPLYKQQEEPQSEEEQSVPEEQEENTAEQELAINEVEQKNNEV